MQKNILFRILLDLLLILSVINGWWFIAVPLALAGALYFPYYVEALFAGIAYDSLFGFVPELGWGAYVGTIVSVVITAGVFGMRKVLRR